MGAFLRRRRFARRRRLADDGAVRVLDLSTDRVVSTVRVRMPIDTALSPDGRLVAVSSQVWLDDADGAVFDVKTGEEAFRLSGAQLLQPPDFSGRCPGVLTADIVAAGSEGATRVWDAETERLAHTLLGQTGYVLGVAWSPDSVSPGHGRFGRHREGVGDPGDAASESCGRSRLKRRAARSWEWPSRPMGPG